MNGPCDQDLDEGFGGDRLHRFRFGFGLSSQEDDCDDLDDRDDELERLLEGRD